MTSNVLQLNSANQAKQFPPLYLQLEGPQRVPTILGTGRSAIVVLATTTEDPTNAANEYQAVKFLRDDPDQQYAAAAAERFFQEAGQVQRFDRLQSAFVRFYSWGALGTPADSKPWWRNQFNLYADQIANPGEEFIRLKEHFGLQGPFYVLSLCQGTLHDLLDKVTPWAELPPNRIATYHTSILNEAERIQRDITEIVSKYLSTSPAGLSGYEILNAFRFGDSPEGRTANSIRNFAVLELFVEIAETVAQLHAKKAQIEPLAHRDIKPGNIFFQHSAFEKGLDQIEIKLSDLGYVTTPKSIQGGEQSLREGRKGADYLAPGSQFFRAPEQAELPIEVRADVSPDDRSVVFIKGSKINNIQVHDWLTLSDLFRDETSTERDIGSGELFKIMKVDYAPLTNTYRLELDKEVVTSKSGDLQGEITRATGFQTDGFSLGSILYDLISGGRNPELFYIYCLASYIGQFSYGGEYTVAGIVEILAPQQQANGTSDIDKLSWAEKTRATQQVWAANDLDGLLGAIQDAILLQRNRNDGQARLRLEEQLKHFRFRSFGLVRELLTDRRGVPIPRDILEIIVRCMIRDAPDSYYRRDTAGGNGFLTDANYEAASRIYEDIRRLLGRQEYQLPKEGFPRSLQSNLLFKLRSLTLKEQAHG